MVAIAKYHHPNFLENIEDIQWFDVDYGIYFTIETRFFISSPELKAQVSFSDQNLSVVRRCCRCRRKLFTFSPSSQEPLGHSKLGTKHPWVVGIQVYSNLKFFFPRTTGPISTKLGTKHSLVKRTQAFTKKDCSVIRKEMIVFSSPNQCYDIIIALRKCFDFN